MEGPGESGVGEYGSMALSDKQQIFVEEYLSTWNAAEAARRAGYSEKTARSQGQRLLTHVDIAEEIKNRVADRAMSADEVLIRLAEQARADQSKYLMPNGVDMEALIRDGKGHLVKGIKETKYGRDIEFYDAQAALVHLGKHHGLFADKVEYSGETTMRVVYGDDGTDDTPT
jgi:phage terminase small subunit